MARRGWLLCLLLAIAGCSVSRYDIGQALPAADLERMQTQGVGVGEVLATLGPPLRLSALEGGYVLAWEYWQIQENQVGVSLRAVGADFFSLDWGAADTRGEFLLLAFDTEHRLTDSTLVRWDRELGGGQGVQPLFSFVSVVDINDLTEPLPTHRWGASNWQDLPRSLNRAQRMDTGGAGLEQRGSAATVGQHALEMQ